MIVLSVSTDNERVEDYIKSRLNYKKLSQDARGSLTTFKVPVRISQSN